MQKKREKPSFEEGLRIRRTRALYTGAFFLYLQKPFINP